MLVRSGRRLAGAALAATLATACGNPQLGAGDHGSALTIQPIYGTAHISGIHVGQVTEILVPVVHNNSVGTLRVKSVSLVDVPPDVHILASDAYRTSRIPVGIMAPDIAFSSGSPGCPRYWGPPRAVTAITVPSHGHATWVAVIVLTVSAPGRYQFGRVKITYTIGGARDWQYQSFSDTIRYSEPRIHGQVSAHDQGGNGCPTTDRRT
jgi:hypothetical protein